MLDMLHLLAVVCLLAAAWLISRGAAYVARNVLVWHDRRNEAAAATAYLRIANVKRRETTVAVIRAAIAYAAFAVAIVLSAAELTGGLDKLTTLAGASFVIILTEGPTTVAKGPWIEEVNALDERLVRIRLRASVVAGREWLVEGFLSDLLKERAGEGLIVHGPVVLTVDEQAARSFARASAATRWAPRPAPQQT